MDRYRTEIENVERRTYFKGALKGKYVGFLDFQDNRLDRERVFNLEIIEAEISILEGDFRKHTENDIFPEGLSVDVFSSKLPASTLIVVHFADGTNRFFNAAVYDLRATDITLTDRIIEDDKSFGSISCTVFAFIKHFDKIEKEVLIEPVEKGPISISEDILETSLTDNKKGTYENYHSKQLSTSTSSDTSEFQKTEKKHTLLEGVWDVISFVFVMLILVALFIKIWPILLVLGIFCVLYFFASFALPIFRFVGMGFLNILGILYLILVLFALYKSISGDGYQVENKSQPDQNREVRTEIPNKEVLNVNRPDDSLSVNNTKDSLNVKKPVDTLIRNFRIWKDYDNNNYQGYISVWKSDLRASTIHKNTSPILVQSQNDFKLVFYDIYQSDVSKLGGVYEMFDSLKSANKFSDIQFAEVIVSCIQDIPYKLILEGPCDASIYNDRFINDYLGTGGQCRPFERYGLLTPVEFAATLDGDCDTRSLLLFALLSHYGYDVALMTSDQYGHAVIAVNLPIIGPSFSISGKRFVFWETTQSGIRPGVFPIKYSNLNNWTISLLFTNQNLQ